ncbi:MAG: universal stress protein [Actinomycetota bacterium]
MYERVLAAVDHSEAARSVLGAVQELALLSHGEVWVLHVQEREPLAKGGGMVSMETTSEAQQVVDLAVDELAQAGVKVHGEVRHSIYGYAARVIVDSAAEHEAGTIVMGSKGRGDLAGLLLGSTAHKVIHLSDRPVLVVR